MVVYTVYTVRYTYQLWQTFNVIKLGTGQANKNFFKHQNKTPFAIRRIQRKMSNTPYISKIATSGVLYDSDRHM